MKIVVNVTTAARQDLLRLLGRRAPNAADAVRFAALYVDDVESQLRKYEGPPPEAQKYTSADGTVWWWHYADGIWTGFTIADQPRWFFRPATRTFTIAAFRVRPPAH